MLKWHEAGVREIDEHPFRLAAFDELEAPRCETVRVAPTAAVGRVSGLVRAEVDDAEIANRLWRDERAFVMSAEIVLIGTVAILATIVGLSAYRDAVIAELAAAWDWAPSLRPKAEDSAE